MMLRAWHVRMRQLINDRDLGPAGDDRVNIHLPERDAAISDLAHRNAFQIADQRLGLGAPVRLHKRYNYIHALLFELMSVFQHLIRFAYARSRADVDAQLRPLALLEFREQRFRRWSAIFTDH